MKNKNDGGPAFSGYDENNDGSKYPVTGMSLRDYLAAKALAGIVGPEDSKDSYTFNAEFAYGQADAMLKEREK